MFPFTLLFPCSPFFLFILLCRAKWGKIFPLKLTVSRVFLSFLFRFSLLSPRPSSFRQYSYLLRSDLSDRGERAGRPIFSALPCRWLWTRLGGKDWIFSHDLSILATTPQLLIIWKSYTSSASMETSPSGASCSVLCNVLKQVSWIFSISLCMGH